jgi:hypothetical protein
MKLETTKDYSLFEANPEQRPIMAGHARKISESMKLVGFIPSKPIQCYRKGKKLIVVDGHHRLEAAKLAGCEVYYVTESADSQNTMASENNLVKRWGGIDFVRLYASRGNHYYMSLLQYRELGIPINMAASMMINNSAASGNANNAIMSGTFKAKSLEQIELVADLIRDYGSASSVLTSRPFIAAISKCILCDQFSIKTFRTRLTENLPMLVKTANEDQMLSLIETIYNRHSRQPVPLKFYVESASRERNAKNLKIKKN